MALNIRNKETERLAREVTELAGETKTEAVKRALRARWRVCAGSGPNAASPTSSTRLHDIAPACPYWMTGQRTRSSGTTSTVCRADGDRRFRSTGDLQDEPGRRAFNEAIEAADSRVMSVANFVEISILIESRYGTEGLRDLDLFLDRAGIGLAEVDVEQGREARRAFSRFGKGRHPAALNYGDCFAYALARVRNQPLLYKGDDFSQTDVIPFVSPPQT